MAISKIILSVLPHLKLANAHKRATAASIIEESVTSPPDEGRECLPKKKRRKLQLLPSKLLGHEVENDKNIPDVSLLNQRKHRLLSSSSKLSTDDITRNHGPDVGILRKCPVNQVCKDDASSFLGGRCVDNAVASARRLEEKEVCYFTCPDPKFCECIYGKSYFSDKTAECTAAIASSCKNGEYAQCIPDHIGDRTALWKTLYCSYHECMDDGQKDYKNCLANAYKEYYEFCKDYFIFDDVGFNSSYCSDVSFSYKISGEYYFKNHLRDPNKFAKRLQLIVQRYKECAPISLTVTAQYQYHNDRGLEEYFQYFDLYDDCFCKRHSALCELYSSTGFYQADNRPECIMAHCCNNPIPDVNWTACFELAATASVDTGPLLSLGFARPILSASPSISPSMEPSNSLPDQSGHKQDNSAYTYPTKSPLGLGWAALLFASTLGFVLFEQLVT